MEQGVGTVIFVIDRHLSLQIGVPIPAKRLPMACNLNGFKRGLTYSFR